MEAITRIALVPNGTKDKGFAVTQAVADIFLAHGVTLTLAEDCPIPLREGLRRAKSVDDLLRDAQLVITLGGDGTILHVAAEAARRALPILGVNMGRVGFMAELEVARLDLLRRLFDGDYAVEERMMLEVCVNGKSLPPLLNDAVITARRGRMMDLTLWENGRRLGTFRGDGLILSTPTGSTAYSLSAGGPVVDPRLEMMLAVPVCAHSLGARPIVFAPDATLCVGELSVQARLCCDGKEETDLKPGDEITVRPSALRTRLIQLSDRPFYTAVRSYFS